MIFPFEWFDSVEKLSRQSPVAYDEYFSQLRRCNPLDKAFSYYQNPLHGGWNTDQTLRKFKLSETPPNGLGEQCLITTSMDYPQPAVFQSLSSLVQ